MSSRRCWGVIALSFAGAALAGAQQPRPVLPLVLDGVTVVDVEHGTLHPAQRVVIVDNRIHAVGKRSVVAIPPGAQVVNAQSKYLIPGLWDLHMHSGRREQEHLPVSYQALLANGITGFRDPGTFMPLDTLAQWRRAILAGELVGPPHQLFSSPPINGPESQCKREPGRGCVSDTADARRLVDSLKTAGADMLKMYSLSAPMYFVLAAEARKLGMPFGGHSTNVSPFAAADSGASILDHARVTNISAVLDSLCFHAFTATVAGCRPVAERWHQTNTWSVPTLAHHAQFETGRHRAARCIPELLNHTVDAFFAGAPYSSHWLRHPAPLPSNDLLRNFPFPWLHVAQQVGLPIAAGTDGGPRDAGFKLHAELAVLVERGLTPLAALQAATLNPAKLLRATDSLGTVAAGKLADLVLLDANPLKDITNTTTIRAVVTNGRYYDRAALDQLLAEVQAALRAVP